MSGIGDNWTSARRSQRTTRSAAQGGQDFEEEIDENLMATDPNSQAQTWQSKKFSQRTHMDDQAEAGGMGSGGTQNIQGGQGMRGVEGSSRTTGGGMGGMHDEGRTEAYPSASSQGRYQSARATDEPGEGMSGMSGKNQGYGEQGYGSHAGRAEPPENQETGGVLGSLGDKVKGAMGDVSKKASKFSGEQ